MRFAPVQFSKSRTFVCVSMLFWSVLGRHCTYNPYTLFGSLFLRHWRHWKTNYVPAAHHPCPMLLICRRCLWSWLLLLNPLGPTTVFCWFLPTMDFIAFEPGVSFLRRESARWDHRRQRRLHASDWNYCRHLWRSYRTSYPYWPEWLSP